jgi:glucosamine kinase
MRLYFGVDAGGTRCRGRVEDEAGHVIGAAEGGSANTRIGMEAVFAVIEDVRDRCLAGLSPEERAGAEIHAGIGIAGLSRPGARAALEAHDFGFAKLALAGDALVANLGAHGGQDGGTLILGTGSIAIVQLDGRAFTMGGYGFPISDEGSGAAIGLSAIRHALRALDGRTTFTSVSAAVAEQVGPGIEAVIAWMDKAGPADYGALAPIVLQHAEDGDEIAVSIVREAARHVEQFVATMLARGAPAVALAGGLSARLRPWLTERIAARLSPAKGTPLDGAMLMARRAG